MSEVFAFEQKGFPHIGRQGVREAIAEVQPRRMIPFAEAPKYRESRGQAPFIIKIIAVVHG